MAEGNRWRAPEAVAARIMEHGSTSAHELSARIPELCHEFEVY